MKKRGVESFEEMWSGVVHEEMWSGVVHEEMWQWSRS